MATRRIVVVWQLKLVLADGRALHDVATERVMKAVLVST